MCDILTFTHTHLSLAALYDDEFLLRWSASKHNLCVVPQNIIQILGAHVLQVWTMNHTGLSISEKHTHTHTHRTVPIFVICEEAIKADKNPFRSSLHTHMHPDSQTNTQPHRPWIDLAQWYIKSFGDILHSLVALRDDAHTFSNGFGGYRMVTCYHDNL